MRRSDKCTFGPVRIPAWPRHATPESLSGNLCTEHIHEGASDRIQLPHVTIKVGQPVVITLHCLNTAHERYSVAGQGVPLEADKITVLAGCGSVLDLLFFCIASEGDAVGIPAPYYPAFDNDLKASRHPLKSVTLCLWSQPGALYTLRCISTTQAEISTCADCHKLCAGSVWASFPGAVS